MKQKKLDRRLKNFLISNLGMDLGGDRRRPLPLQSACMGILLAPNPSHSYGRPQSLLWAPPVMPWASPVIPIGAPSHSYMYGRPQSFLLAPPSRSSRCWAPVRASSAFRIDTMSRIIALDRCQWQRCEKTSGFGSNPILASSGNTPHRERRPFVKCVCPLEELLD